MDNQEANEPGEITSERPSSALGATDYWKLFQHAHDAILILDPVEEEILEVNRRACELYGFDRDELIGRSMIELAPDNRRPVDHVSPTLESEDRYSFETVQKRKDGREIRLEIHAAVVEFRGRRAILSINRDITQRRQREDDLARHRARLEETVRDRTARLERANKDLESKNTELESFSYAVAHGFKSPLVTIRGYLSLFERDGVAGDARSRRGIAHIQGALGKMGRFVDHLLDLSRAGRIIEQPSTVALRELVDDTIDLLSGVLGERGVEVVVSEDLPTLHGDPARLGEVLRNLVENAVKYMGDQPDPRLEIGASQEGEEVVIYVRDNGMGIDSSQQEKIFGFFERAEVGSAKGMGIGLALTRRIIEVHGGRIWVESAGRNRGSTVRFTLPVAPAHGRPGQLSELGEG